MVRSNCILLMLFLLIQCKTNQHAGAIVKTEDDEVYTQFYSKINGTVIKLYQTDDRLSCLKDSLLQSFQYNLPRLIMEDLNVSAIYLDATPFVTDSTACEGLYIYRTWAGAPKHVRKKYVYRGAPRYLRGAPYHFYAINGNEVLFFKREDIEENKKKLARLKGMPVYEKILKYEQNILNNLILIK